MSTDMSMDMKKERIRELNHRQKVRYRTLLLPALVAWNTLDTRGSTASHRHIEILKSCNSYHSTLFDMSHWIMYHLIAHIHNHVSKSINISGILSKHVKMTLKILVSRKNMTSCPCKGYMYYSDCAYANKS